MEASPKFNDTYKRYRVRMIYAFHCVTQILTQISTVKDGWNQIYILST